MTDAEHRVYQIIAAVLAPFFFIAGLPIIVAIYEVITDLMSGILREDLLFIDLFAQFWAIAAFIGLAVFCYKFVEHAGWGWFEN